MGSNAPEDTETNVLGLQARAPGQRKQISEKSRLRTIAEDSRDQVCTPIDWCLTSFLPILISTQPVSSLKGDARLESLFHASDVIAEESILC
jgi:hypothetical protein